MSRWHYSEDRVTDAFGGTRYLPPNAGWLFRAGDDDHDALCAAISAEVRRAARPVPHAPTVPLRVPARRRRISVGLAVVAVAVLLSGLVTALAVYETALWLVEGMQARDYQERTGRT